MDNLPAENETKPVVCSIIQSMNKQNLGFLSAHFHYEYRSAKVVALQEKGGDYMQFYEDYYEQFKYAVCLVESKTKKIIRYFFTNERGFYFHPFMHYLNQLPDLSLKNVIYFFNLINYTENVPLLKNAFQVPDNYPSEYAKELLAETYGYLVYRYQLYELLRSCCPFEYASDDTRFYKFRRDMQGTGKYQACLKQIRDWRLPDNYPLINILQNYTLPNDHIEGILFLDNPRYKEAYKFIKTSKKSVG